MKPSLRRFRPQVQRLESRRLLAGDGGLGQIVYLEDFESGDGGYVADNRGGNLTGLWHYTDGRSADGLPGHSPAHSWYYGDLEDVTGGGQYATYDTHRGTLTSPLIELPEHCRSELSFNYFLETRPPLNLDFVEVYVIDAGNRTRVLSREAGDLVQGLGTWQNATADVTAFNGRDVQLQFVFDTGPAIAIDPEGWYVDDIQITQYVSADVAVSKTIDDATPNEGQSVTYTIVASNSDTSCSTATGVMVTDQFPSGVSIESFGAEEGEFDPETGVWDQFELDPGESRQLQVTVLVGAGTTGSDLVNVATITSDQEDPDESNNRAEQESSVNRVDLSATKSSSESMPFLDSEVVFQIDVLNSSDSNAIATGITVVDRLPEGLRFVSASDGGVYDATTQTVTWAIDPIPAGASVGLSLTAVAEGVDLNQSLLNAVRAVAIETDPNLVNNESSFSVTPQPVVSQLVQFVTPLSVFRSGKTVLPAASQILASGFVWNDANANGIREASESGVSGVRLDFLRDVNPNVAGPELVSSVQTRTVDLNDDGAIDPDGESGVWFLPSGALPAGTYEVRVSRPADVDVTSPSVEPFQLTIDDEGVAAMLDFGISRDFVRTPSDDRGTISGFAWADVNLDGQFDPEEKPRTDVQVFLDLNPDGVFDPASEPSSFTDDQGRYRFADLSPGTYVIREFNVNQAFGADPDRGIVFVSTVPDNETSEVTAFHEVDLSAGAVIEGQFGTADVPNFGAAEIGRYVRPADQFAEWLGDYPMLDDALKTTQAFEIQNTSDLPLSLEGINDSGLDDESRPFVKVQMVDDSGEFIEPSFPIELAAGATASFFILYDPAIRDESGLVSSQRPDWLGPDADPRPHDFGPTEQIAVTTDRGLEFPVRLVGGSTFDSDINYDGQVNQGDFVLLNDVLLRDTSVTRGVSKRFDPTFDINARCPNGAGQATGVCSFASGTPDRELSLGDFGPLNVESVRPRRAAIALEVTLPPPIAIEPAMAVAAGEPLSMLATTQAVFVGSALVPFDHESDRSNDVSNCIAVFEAVSVDDVVPDSNPADEVLTEAIHWCDPGDLLSDDEDEFWATQVDEVLNLS